MFEFFKKGLSKTIGAMLDAKGEDKISKEILEDLLLYVVSYTYYSMYL